MNRRQWREIHGHQSVPGQEDDYDRFYKYWRRYKWFQLVWPLMIAGMIISSEINFKITIDFFNAGGLFIIFGIPGAFGYFYFRPYLRCPECKRVVVGGLILNDVKFIYIGDCPHCGNKIKA